MLMKEKSSFKEAVAYNGVQITSPVNKGTPKVGDPCHSLSTDSRNYVVESHQQDTRKNRGDNTPMVKQNAVVRRLTPMECERLQGYPDDWTKIGEWFDSKGKKHKEADSPRYKALGNSIALPFWEWLAERMVDQLKADGVEAPTMASLFDGIGGFPLVYSRHDCMPIWASEIEEFPIAVTKLRFPEQEENET